MDGKIVSRWKIGVIGIVLLVSLVVAFPYSQSEQEKDHSHVFDKVGILSASDVGKFQQYLDFIENESDIDIKFLFLESIGSAAIEEIAVEKMNELGIGRDGREARGVLFLYVMDQKALRIEVGYGLEAYFPDSFVSYLIREQADAFFKASNPGAGLRLLIRMLHHRIREAKLSREYDPTILNSRREHSKLSGGAGARGKVDTHSPMRVFKRDQLDDADKSRFIAANTVDGTYSNYIAWLYGREFDPNIGLFTRDSRSFLNQLPMTEAYFDYILLLYAGKQYKVVERGDLAVLFFTDDPLVTPLFFKRTDGLWKIDIAAELRNSRNHIGGVYTWAFNPDSGDEYATQFRDLLVNIRGYYRFRNGDNRELPVKVDVQKEGKL